MALQLLSLAPLLSSVNSRMALALLMAAAAPPAIMANSTSSCASTTQAGAQNVTGPVRLGALFPSDARGRKRMFAFTMALDEINNSSELLPNTPLLWAWRDDDDDAGAAILGAVELIQQAFDGAGVAAIVGAASSGATMAAAAVAAKFETPLLSYSATSAALSDHAAYAYFLRTVPSDAFQAEAIVGVLVHELGYTRAAIAVSLDAYGSAGREAFVLAAAAAGLEVIAEVGFYADSEEEDLSGPVRRLVEADATIVVLFSPAAGAGRFLVAAHAQGLTGEGHLWFGSDAATTTDLWQSNAQLSSDAALRTAVLTGYFGVRPRAVANTSAAAAFAARFSLRAPTTGNTGDAANANNGTGAAMACDPATDDDGTRLWLSASDTDGTSCDGTTAAEAAMDGYAAYAYDAAYAVAHALHQLIEVQRVRPTSMAKVFSVLVRRRGWPPRAPQAASEGLGLHYALGEERPSRSDSTEGPWPCRQRRRKMPISLRLTVQADVQRLRAARRAGGRGTIRRRHRPRRPERRSHGRAAGRRGERHCVECDHGGKRNSGGGEHGGGGDQHVRARRPHRRCLVHSAQLRRRRRGPARRGRVEHVRLRQR